MTKVISTTVSDEFWQMAKDNKIAWNEALAIGLSIKFGDLGLLDYDNALNIKRKMDKFRLEAENALQQLAELEEKCKQKN
jgi:hypothetical protein